jgi:hypothetical protein
MCDVPSRAVGCSKTSYCFPSISLNILSLFLWPQLMTVPSFTFVLSLYITSCILLSFLLAFAWHSLSQVLPSLSGCTIFFFVFSYYIRHICYNFSICVVTLILKHCFPFVFTCWLECECVCIIILSVDAWYFAFWITIMRIIIIIIIIIIITSLQSTVLVFAVYSTHIQKHTLYIIAALIVNWQN